MGDGVSLNSGNDKFKIDFKKLFDFKTYYATETTIPTIDLSGNGNWGNVGDSVAFSSDKGQKVYSTPEQAYGTGTSSSATNPVSNGNTTDQEIEEGNSALSSKDVNVVRAAKTGVDNLVSSPEAAASVDAAGTEATNAKNTVATNEEGVGRATGEQEAAQGVKEAAEVTEEQSQTKVESQKADLEAKKANLTKAEAAETKAQANKTAAEATVASCKTTVTEAKAAVAAASSAVPFSAGALAAAKAALAAAEAALKAAEAKLEVAKAELQKATAQKEQATAERDQSQAQLDQDEEALQKAEKDLTKAKEDVDAANEKLQNAKQQLETAQADLETKATAYEAVKSDVQKLSSDLSKKLDETLKKLEDGEETEGAAAETGNQNNWMQKGQSVMNLFNQGMNGINSLTGGAAQDASETTSSKRKPTAYDNAVLNATLNSTASFITKGESNGWNFANANTSTTSTNTTNPFNKKKIEE